MSTTAVRSEPQAAVGRIEDASLAEGLKFVATGLLPSLVRGLFKPRRWAMKGLTALDADSRAIQVLSAIREKHGGEGARLLGGRMVVLWGAAAIREVLDKSADLYAADSGAKGKGMSHFQPDALTISRGEEWRDRRAFNEAVLAYSERVHPDASRMLAVVADEIARLRIGPELEWDAFEGLWDHITLRVIFGDRARGDQELTGLLGRLMEEGQRLVGVGPNDEYYEFYGRLEEYLRDPEPGTLLARIPSAPQSDRTRVVHQIPHWMFAMRDTLAANAYRALAVIAADSALRARVREEIGSAGELSDPGAIDGMRLLEGVLHEAMRLWPTTPLLARETTRDASLCGAKLDEGTQVMLLNVFNHRCPAGVSDAGRVVPERWAGDKPTDYRFNHLSNGSQDCPGGPLVLLLGKAVIAQMLEEWELSLSQPSLPEGGDMPAMLDFFAIRFAVDPR